MTQRRFEEVLAEIQGHAAGEAQNAETDLGRKPRDGWEEKYCLCPCLQ